MRLALYYNPISGPAHQPDSGTNTRQSDCSASGRTWR